MSDSHELYREWSAAYVLGALDADDRATFESHLASCEHCRTEVASFAPIPGLLGRVELEDLDLPEVPERVIVNATALAAAELETLETSRKRWRVVSVAAVSVLFLVGLVGITSWRGSDDVTPAEFAYEDDSVVFGSIDAVERSWGTQVRVDLEGLPERDIYFLWAVTEDGEAAQVASWTATEDGTAIFEGTTAVEVDQLMWLRITSGDTDDLLFNAWQVSDL